MVDPDRVEGAGKKMGGSLEEGAGKLLGDTNMQARGAARKMEGKTQNFWGGLKDMLRGKRHDDYDRRS